MPVMRIDRCSNSLKQGANALADIDPEAFTDFATVRPHVRLDEQQRRNIVATVGVWSASLPGSDVIFVLGPEPTALKPLQVRCWYR